jgi:L,D-transpeptidase catalytic domain
MKRLALLLALALSATWLTGCVSTGGHFGAYNVTAYKPHNPDNVRIKVSLQNRAVYVMEGDRPLLVTPTAIGKPDHRTPTGSFRIYNKIAEKRSGSYGFSVSGGSVTPCEAGRCSGRYVGFPMAWWCEFSPGYGFHEGAVWPIPRTHGCLRLHKNAAPKFYALAKIGTPVNIAQTQPEDATIGRNLARPNDYNDPDPAASFMVSPAVFHAPSGPLLIEQP